MTSLRTIGSVGIFLIVYCSALLANGADSTRSAPPPTLPFLSQYDSTKAVEQLRQRLNAIFDRSRTANISVAVVSLKRNVVMYERNATTALTPASTTKLFSTGTAFHLLGDRPVISTDVRIDGSIDASGTLHGDLYLVGHGDAMLSVNDLEELADEVHRAGIRRITGSIYGDGSFFDNVTQRAIYSGDGETVQGMPPVTALGVNNNTVAVLVQGSSSGRTFMQTIPASEALTVSRGRPVAPPPTAKATPPVVKQRHASKSIHGRAAKPALPPKRPHVKASAPTPKHHHQPKKHAPAAKRARKHALLINSLEEQRWGDVPPAPRHRSRGRVRASRVSISSSTTASGGQHFVVRGSPGAHRTYAQYFVMTNPITAAAGTFLVRLRSGGIDVNGAYGQRTAPSSCSTIAVFRRPFVDFASVVNKRSDNYYAEHAFKIVGGLCADNANTAARAKRAVLDVMDTLHVPHEGCVFNDGSGLSRRNRVSAMTELRWLQAISKQKWAEAFRQTLSIASVDGTLRRRMAGTPAAGNVRAKTGTLRNVSALAGYVSTLDGEPLVFSFISNGPSVGSYKAMENLAAITLASFSYKTGAPAIEKVAGSAEQDTTDDGVDDLRIGAEPPAPSKRP